MNELFENEYKMETKLYKEYVYNVLCKKNNYNWFDNNDIRNIYVFCNGSR